MRAWTRGNIGDRGEKEREREIGSFILGRSPSFSLLLFSFSSLFWLVVGHSHTNRKRREKIQKYSYEWLFNDTDDIIHLPSFTSNDNIIAGCREADCLRAKEGLFQQLRRFGRGCCRHFVQPGYASARQLDRRLVSLFWSEQRNERQEARVDLFCQLCAIQNGHGWLLQVPGELVGLRKRRRVWQRQIFDWWHQIRMRRNPIWQDLRLGRQLCWFQRWFRLWYVKTARFCFFFLVCKLLQEGLHIMELW